MKKTGKDEIKFIEAFRESYLEDILPEESTDGWAVVSSKMRSRAIVRRCVAAACLCLPLAAVGIVGVRLLNSESSEVDLVAQSSGPSEVNLVVPASDTSEVELMAQISGASEVEPITQSSEVSEVELVMPVSEVSEVSEVEPITQSSEVSEVELVQKEVEEEIKANAVRTSSSRNGISLSASVNGMPATSGKTMGATSLMISASPFSPDIKSYKAPLETIYSNSEFSHFMPFGATVLVSFNFERNLALSTGLAYTMLYSRAQEQGGGDIMKQYVHYVGIPVTLDWHFFNRSGFSLYSRLGGRMDICAGARFGNEKMQEKPLQWTLSASVGANYNFNRTIGLFIQPELDWYITQTSLKTIRSQSPVNATLRIGLTFNLL
ncbi:MAG: hypothetical protein PUC61_10635 [Bacteroidales bacterium]|nr:hypothetical protein [Bacteroidales bacterium]